MSKTSRTHPKMRKAHKKRNGILNFLQNRRKNHEWLDEPDFGSDQKYYDCFAKIWGWNGCKKNPAQGVEELESLMKSQADVKWDQKAPFNAELQFEVGVAYLSGWLTSLNSNEPLLWFSRSAKQESPRGLLAMGYLYEKGRWGCRYDPVEMLSYYRRAANLGNAPAMYRLAYLAHTLKIGDNKDVVKLLTQAAPKYYPAKILLAKEYPDVAYSRKYRKLYSDEWDDIEEESIPAVEVKNRRKMKELIQMDEDEFSELEDEFEPIVEPTPVLGWGVNSDPDEPYPDEMYSWEEETWESQTSAAEEPVATSDPELDQIFSIFDTVKTTPTTEPASEPRWKSDTVIIPPLEEASVPEKKNNKKRRKKKKTHLESKENQEAVDTTSQLILKKLVDLGEELRKAREQERIEHEKMQHTSEEIKQTTKEIHKDTRHIVKTVVENKELLISLDISVKILQSSLQGMWTDLQNVEEKFSVRLETLQRETETQLSSVSQKELEDAEKFMALIFLGDWRESNRLSNESCDALVAARVLMKAAKNMGVKNYAGIVITAVWALEHECRRRFYDKFDRYLESLGVEAEDRADRMNLRGKFTLGSVAHVTHSYDYNEFSRTTNLLSKIAKEEQNDQGFDDAKMVWKYRIPGTKRPDERGLSFTDIVVKLNNEYRIPAAHAKPVSKEKADACYNMLGITDAHKGMNSVTGALKALLWLTAPLDELKT